MTCVLQVLFDWFPTRAVDALMPHFLTVAFTGLRDGSTPDDALLRSCGAMARALRSEAQLHFMLDRLRLHVLEAKDMTLKSLCDVVGVVLVSVELPLVGIVQAEVEQVVKLGERIRR